MKSASIDTLNVKPTVTVVTTPPLLASAHDAVGHRGVVVVRVHVGHHLALSVTAASSWALDRIAADANESYVTHALSSYAPSVQVAELGTLHLAARRTNPTVLARASSWWTVVAWKSSREMFLKFFLFHRLNAFSMSTACRKIFITLTRAGL
jgi:hypothetical protein